jgi:tripartite ATP-independent transporter DctM subunit
MLTFEIMAPLMFAGMILFMLFGFPVAFSLAAVGLFFGLIGIEYGFFPYNFLEALPLRIFGIMSNDLLLAIPFFTFMGAILERCGLAEDLLEGTGQLFGPVPGGLAYAVIVVGAILGAITGTVAASVIAMGLISLPVMMRYGYNMRLATGVIAASGTITQLIPPSLVLVVLADQLGKSVGDMYRGAVGPSILQTVLFVLFILGVSLVKPKSMPPLPVEARTLRGWALWKRVLWGMIPSLVLIFLVLGTIFLGLATPTEAGAMGAVGAIVLAVLHSPQISRLGKLAAIVGGIILAVLAIPTAIPYLPSLAAAAVVVVVGGYLLKPVWRFPGGGDASKAVAYGLIGGLVVGLAWWAFSAGASMNTGLKMAAVALVVAVGGTLFNLMSRESALGMVAKVIVCIVFGVVFAWLAWRAFSLVDAQVSAALKPVGASARKLVDPIHTPLFFVFYAALAVLLWEAVRITELRGLIKQAFETTMRISAMVMFILIGATVFSLVFQGVDGGKWIEHLLSGLPGGVVGFLIFVNIFVFLLAFFLDFFEIAFVVVPLLAPVAQKLLTGYVGAEHALIWFGVLICVNVQTSFMHPPFGFALFYLRGIAPASVRSSDIYWGAVPWVLLQLILVVIVIFWPESVTFWLDSGPTVDPSKIKIDIPSTETPAPPPPPDFK